MKMRVGWAAGIATALAVLIAAYLLVANRVPMVAAAALLHPARRPVGIQRPASCVDAVFSGAGVILRGWRCGASGRALGTLVFLHGIGDNRASVAGVLDRFVPKGLTVVAYDSRAQGESGGAACTYGYWEKQDLRKVIDTLDPGPVILLGSSLGAAVALQEAADDGRVTGIVAAEVFSDLETVARERAPRLLTESMIRTAFRIAEAEGDFRVSTVSPLAAARRIHVPVLLIHGARDTDTPPDHSRRVLAALAGPKRLLMVEGAGHNESLRSEETWQQIERWVEDVVRRPPG